MSSSVEQLEALKAKAEAGGLDMDSTDMENQIEQILAGGSARGPPQGQKGALSPQQIAALMQAGAQMQKMPGKTRLSKYYADPIKATEEARKAAKASREGDHDDALLGAYAKFFEMLTPGASPPPPSKFGIIPDWLGAMSRNELFSILAVFR
eukprot:gene21050-17733_t